MGIETFTSALAMVAVLNGLEPSARSWRHGSIQRRIAFLQSLVDRPEVESRFQKTVRWLRLGLALGLILALVVAIRTGAFSQL